MVAYSFALTVTVEGRGMILVGKSLVKSVVPALTILTPAYVVITAFESASWVYTSILHLSLVTSALSLSEFYVLNSNLIKVLVTAFLVKS